MATVSKWTPFDVALDITATGGTVTRKSATQYTVKINASWETYYNGAKTNFGMTASSGGGSVNLNTFGTKSSSGNGSFTGTYSISGNGSASKTITVTFKNYEEDWQGNVTQSKTKTVSFNVTVPAWTSYTVKYNANGGSGAPSSQTKWKDQSLILSSTKPTRSGYTFKGWATSSNGSVAYASGASYTANANIVLYAIWQKNTYTVKYNANGGTGSPTSATAVATTTYSFEKWHVGSATGPLLLADMLSGTAWNNSDLYTISLEGTCIGADGVDYNGIIEEYAIYASNSTIGYTPVTEKLASALKQIVKKLGAKVIKINCTKNGKKINENCGALYPEILSKKVIKYK